MAERTLLEEFFVSLGFDVDETGVRAFQESLTSVIKTAGTAIIALEGAALAIGGFTASVAASIDDIGDFAERENVAIEAVTELGHAAQLSGSSLEAVQSSISGLNRVAGEAAIGLGRGKLAFERLGLSVKDASGQVKPFDILLGEIADKMRGLSTQERIAMAEKLGLDRSLIPLLLKGKEGIQELREEARALGGSLTQADAELAGALQDSMDRFKFVLNGIKNQIGLALMPQVKEVIDGFMAWTQANKEVIRTNIVDAVKVLSIGIKLAWEVTKGLVNGLIELKRWLTETRPGIIAFGTALSLLAKFLVYDRLLRFVTALRAMVGVFTVANIAAFATSIAIGALLIGLGLLIEDVYQWGKGNESVTGKILEDHPKIKKLFEDIGKTIKEDSRLIHRLASDWAEGFADIRAKGEAFGKWFKAHFDNFALASATFIERLVGDFQTGYTDLKTRTGAFITGVKAFFSSLGDWVLGVVDRIVHRFQAMLETLKAGIKTVKGLFGGDDRTVVAPPTVRRERQERLVQRSPEVARSLTEDLLSPKKPIVGPLTRSLPVQPYSAPLTRSLPVQPYSAPLTRLSKGPIGGLAGSGIQREFTGSQKAQIPPIQPTTGLLGRAEQTITHATTTDNRQVITNITGTKIEIKTDRPEKAGEAVRSEFNRMEKNATRNAQSQVAL